LFREAERTQAPGFSPPALGRTGVWLSRCALSRSAPAAMRLQAVLGEAARTRRRGVNALSVTAERARAAAPQLEISKKTFKEQKR